MWRDLQGTHANTEVEKDQVRICPTEFQWLRKGWIYSFRSSAELKMENFNFQSCVLYVCVHTHTHAHLWWERTEASQSTQKIKCDFLNSAGLHFTRGKNCHIYSHCCLLHNYFRVLSFSLKMICHKCEGRRNSFQSTNLHIFHSWKQHSFGGTVDLAFNYKLWLLDVIHGLRWHRAFLSAQRITVLHLIPKLLLLTTSLVKHSCCWCPVGNQELFQ